MRGPQRKIYIYIYIHTYKYMYMQRERERDYVNMSQLFLPASCLDTTYYETFHVLNHAVFNCVTFKIAKLKPPAVVADAGRKDD